MPAPLRNVLNIDVVTHFDVNGPGSPPGYSQSTGITATANGLRQVTSAVATPGSNSSSYFVSVDPPTGLGNAVTLHIYSGTSEVANGTNLSLATFHVLARGF